MDLKNAVIYAYSAARERGDSRSDAFFHAVSVYRSQCPDLPINRAGTEVARILLAAVQSQLEAESSTMPLAATEEGSLTETA
jgi:hypothetical protein